MMRSPIVPAFLVLAGSLVAACNLLLPSYSSYGTGGGSSSSTSSGGGSDGGTGGDGDAGMAEGGPTRGIWSVSSPGTTVKGVAVDGTGNVYLTGRSDGTTVPFGCSGTDAGSGTGTGYLVELDSSGKCLWSFLFGDSAEGTSVAVDAMGNVGLSANYTGSVTLDPNWFFFPEQTKAGQTDSFVVLIGSDHTFRWAHAFVDDQGGQPAGDHKATSVGFGDGRLAVAVTYTSSARFTSAPGSAGQPMTISGSSDGEDSFAAWFNVTGGVYDNFAYARSSNNGTDQAIESVAIDPSGNVATAGTTTGTASFTNDMAGTSSPGSIFVAAADALGTGKGASAFGGGLAQEGKAVAYDVMADILVGGTFYGNAVLPGAMDGGTYPSLGRSVLIARYNPPAQSFIGAIQLASGDANSNATLGGMVPYTLAGVVFAGGFQGTVNLPDGKSVTAGPNSTAVYVTKVAIGLDGGVWLESYGDGTSHQVADTVAVDPNSGEILVAGHFHGTLAFGGAALPLANTGATDQLFVAKLEP